MKFSFVPNVLVGNADKKSDIVLLKVCIPKLELGNETNNAVKFNEATQELGVKASVTGHSLGGGEAAAASEKTGFPSFPTSLLGMQIKK